MSGRARGGGVGQGSGQTQARAESGPDAADLARYHAAVARLDDLIDRTDAKSSSPDEARALAAHRLARLRRYLASIGDPHLGLPTVHVAGTSGKGSTSTAIAAIATAAGYRVGLYTSPYLQAATEKLQIDGRLIDPAEFADLVDGTLAAIARWRRGGGEQLAYAEVWTLLALAWFRDQNVDLAVVEVGAGGRFDPTNVVQPLVSVITTVGLDHTATLGPTIPEIAWHKAGIIKPGAPVVTAVTDPLALDVILAEATAARVPVRRVDETGVTTIVTASPTAAPGRLPAVGSHQSRGATLRTRLVGRFQAANAATAVAAVRALDPVAFVVPEAAVARGLARARIPGRLEPMPRASPGEPRVVLDGAHNPEKVAALAADLPALVGSRGRVVVVFGALDGKPAPEMLRRLLPHAGAVVLTAPRVLTKRGAAAAELAAAARAEGYAGTIAVEADPGRSVERGLALATSSRDVVLVTGSLYLVGNVRGRWFPDEEIVRQRTPWPRGR